LPLVQSNNLGGPGKDFKRGTGVVFQTGFELFGSKCTQQGSLCERAVIVGGGTNGSNWGNAEKSGYPVTFLCA